MRVKGVTPILNVSNIVESFEWFTKLGWEKRWDWGDPPEFGAVGAGASEIFLCQDGQGGRDTRIPAITGGSSDAQSPGQGTWMSIWVDDVDTVHRRCEDEGLDVTYRPRDEPWNVREMHVRHPDGHIFRIGHVIDRSEEQDMPRQIRDAGPALEIERVDVPVRLERRLAALLYDLAAHKQMSLDSCLEETLLHTMERYGDGVASPHTETTLEFIQDLKQAHGIDYDCHASYRFVESRGRNT